MATDVLVIGSGGREHALAWKLKQSPRIGKLYIAPGNAGTSALGENVAIEAMDFEGLARFAAEKKVGLTVVGPDDPLAGGIVDLFEKRGLRIFGPRKDAAQIEGSKVFAKGLMKEAKIPTARFEVFTNPGRALSYVRGLSLPVVVKASGLALGKGVYVCKTFEEASAAIDAIMVQNVHGAAGTEVVVEEFLDGVEISIHALSDGIDHVMFPPSQDHKRAQDGDQGDQTGGMGAFAPIPWVTDEMMGHIESAVVSATFGALGKRGIEYKGLLYPGIMVTVDGPKVLEFNARFGDPECQVYMRLLKNDLLDLLEASVDGTITTIKKFVEWQRGFAVNVIVASGGYPGSYKKGFPIEGVEKAEQVEGVVVFHAGTKHDGGHLITNGGRVLGVSAIAPTLKGALDRAYKAIGEIHFEGMHYRRDIGAKALEFYTTTFV